MGHRSLRFNPLASRPAYSHTRSTKLSTTRFSPALSKLNGELVAVDVDDVAVAEFLVEHAVADREGGDGAGGFGDQLAFDGERAAAARRRRGRRACRPSHAPSLALPRKPRGRA